MDQHKREDALEEKSFAEFMSESPVERDWMHPGQKVAAVVVKITPEWIFIDLGSKSEGYLEGKEFLDAEGNLTVKEGDTIRAYFLSSRNNEKLFTTKVGRGIAGKAYLEDAWLNGIPLEGAIAKEVKGGLEIMITGDVSAFCPFSQFGAPRDANIADYIGKRMAFKILEYGENGRNIILSHRTIMEEENKKARETLKESLKEGMTVQGVVISIHKFGAFVDIGGIHGLLPLSEIGWNRAEEINDAISLGKELSLTIIKLNWETDQITLSRKATLPDPWANIETDFLKGSCHSGTVTSLTDFGAFVTLESGVDGLIHISKLAKGKRIKHAGEVLAKGQKVEVRIEALDVTKKRISLTLVGSDEEEDKEQVDDYHKYMGETSSSFGSLGDLFKGKTKA